MAGDAKLRCPQFLVIGQGVGDDMVVRRLKQVDTGPDLPVSGSLGP